MSFFAVLLALLIEQFKPLPTNNPVHDSLSSWARWVGRNFDAGGDSHARVVWAISVLGPAALAAGSYWAIHAYSNVLALGWDVLVLYMTLGFRQFSHHFTDIRDALDQGREDRARELLAQWRHVDASDLPRSELLRHVIEYSLLAAHRHVFGVFFWFVVLSTLGLGPMGAVFYRMAEFMSRYWGYKSHTTGEATHERLLNLSSQLFVWIDHVPARLTAFGFAVVGNFEEAVESWRRYASLWAHPSEGIVLAAAAGALGVQLGGREAPAAGLDVTRTFTDGDGAEVGAAAGSTGGLPPQLAHLRNVVALIWRSMVLWMLLLALLSLANLVG
jgi:adenosylcobinamide-phosphate synthase